MAQGFYTLEEAANRLGLPPDELNRMAQQRQLRAFADRGSWRFRCQDIDEMAGQQGSGGGAETPANGEPAPPPADPGLDDLIPFDAGLDVDPQPVVPPKTDEDLIPIDDLLDNPPPAGGISGINLGDDLAPAPAAAAKPESDVRLKLEPSNSEFELTTESSPGMDPAPESPPAEAARATGGPMMLDADLGLENGPPSVLDSDPTPGLGLDLAPEPGPAPDLDAGLDLAPEPGPAPDLDAGLDLAPEPAPAPDLDAGLDLAPEPAPAPDLDAGLEPGLEPTPLPDLDAGLEPGLEPTPLPDLDAGLEPAPEPAPLPDSDPNAGFNLELAPEAGAPALEGDNEVSVDFDSSTLDDSMVSMGGPRADSDVRLEAAGISQAPLDGGAPPVESFPTEEIDLDAELQEADQASMERRGKTKVTPGPQAASMPAKGTMLPTSSPFELSADDLEFSTSGSSVDQPLGSEFELTLAPEDGSSPLNLGDDEDDVDLGGLPPKDGKSSTARSSELSGINLHNPADSGVSLDEGDSASDSVDFELTVDDDMAGPKTIKGKLPDSDSEFELTLEDDSSGGSLPGLEVEPSTSTSDSDQKDIFETDFNLPAMEGEESHSEAVALDGADTDLESSDFDLAVSDTDLESHAAAADVDESGSEVVVLPDEEEAAAPAPGKKSRGTGGSLDSVDELLLDDDGLEVEEEEEEDDELSPAAQTIPAAQADWGVVPVFLLVPCVLVMFVAGLMSYELLHGMWGYHAASKPSGLVVRGIAGLFVDDLPKE